MSAPTTAGPLERTVTDADPRPVRFRHQVRAEWTKFRTVRGWVIGLLVAALVTVLLGLLTASGSRCSMGPFPGQPVARPCTGVIGPGGTAVTDSFSFVRRPLAATGSITARVTSLTGAGPSGGSGGGGGLTPWTKAGLMIKASAEPGSSYAAIMVTAAHGVRFQSDFTHDSAGPSEAVTAASPRWLRLTRAGDVVTGYCSTDGVHWTRVSVATLRRLPSIAPAGLFAASPYSVQLSRASVGAFHAVVGRTQVSAGFDHVGLSGARAGSAWTGSRIGADDQADPLLPVAGFQRSSGGFTLIGSGDVAPAGPGGTAPGSALEQTLTGLFGGLVVVTVLGAGFITAEYRRGLIRLTLAASPRRGRMLAAKAVVIAAVTFVTGTATAAVAVGVGVPMLRSGGNFVYPVPVWTQVRVLAGVGALLAAVAVLALAAGTLLRRGAGAITSVIAVTVLPYLLAVTGVLPAGPAQWLLRVSPAAGFAVQQSLPRYPQVDNRYTLANGYFPLPPWAGFAVLAAWAGLALLLAGYRLDRSDA